jgi:hypothetical protein
MSPLSLSILNHHCLLHRWSPSLLRYFIPCAVQYWFWIQGKVNDNLIGWFGRSKCRGAKLLSSLKQRHRQKLKLDSVSRQCDNMILELRHIDSRHLYILKWWISSS